MYHRRQRRNDLVVSDSTSSRCTAWHTAQVKRTIQHFSPAFRVRGPAKSIPLTSNGVDSPTLSCGKLTVGVSVSGNVSLKHFLISLRTVLLPFITQIFSLNFDNRICTPA
ncbi:hypothetical protein TNIN_121581 [Trichonephila inaurata madagascariensis]|uniref:Uncharacterized protein n=1 Tax=Trichonephila inaurata madagascariensis TaxID=2747483 RepID=A0A8X6KF38_9ARAC|nr:hypothetical protein TNIN_121581 [Trichonephila inaurata madagascariensis]